MATGEQVPWLTLVTRGLLLDHGQRGAGGRLAQGVPPALLDLHLQFGKRGRCLKGRARSIWGGVALRPQWSPAPQQAPGPRCGVKAAGRELL